MKGGNTTKGKPVAGTPSKPSSSTSSVKPSSVKPSSSSSTGRPGNSSPPKSNSTSSAASTTKTSNTAASKTGKSPSPPKSRNNATQPGSKDSSPARGRPDAKAATGGNKVAGAKGVAGTAKANPGAKPSNTSADKTKGKVPGVAAAEAKPTGNKLTPAEIEQLSKQITKFAFDSDTKKMKALIDAHGPPFPPNWKEVINAYDDDGNTVFMVAVGRPNPIPCKECATMLMQQGALLNEQNKDGWTALMFALKRGHSSIVEMLLEAKADYEIKNSAGKAAIDIAHDATSQNLIRTLIQKKAEQIAAEKKHAAGLAFIARMNEGNLPDIKRAYEHCNELFKNSFDINYRGPDPKGPTPLQIAIEKHGNIELADWLLALGADPFSLDGQKRTIFIRLLLQPRLPSFPNTALSRKKEEVRVSLMKYLVESPHVKGSKAHIKAKDKSGTAPIHHAAMMGNLEDIRYLIELGFDVDERQVSPAHYRGYPSQRAQNGDTALCIAAKRLNIEMVKILIEEGNADIDAAGEGMTPLAWATWYQNIELMTYLIGAGASVNAQSNSLFNESILFWAIQRHNTQAATLLLNFRNVENDPCTIAEKAFIAKFGRRARPEKKKPSMFGMFSRGKDKGKGGKGGRGGGSARSASSGSRGKSTPKSKSRSPTPGLQSKAPDKKKDNISDKVDEQENENDDDDDASSGEEEEKKEVGVQPDLPCRNGATPLLLLMRHSQVYPAEEKLPLAELLIARGASVNVISTDKMTPLLWAVLNVQAPLVKLLLAHGADPFLKNSNGFIPFELTENFEMKSLLSEQMDRMKRNQKLREEASDKASIAKDKEHDSGKDKVKANEKKQSPPAKGNAKTKK